MELGKFFEKYGDVRTVKILENKEGEDFTSGYVNFNDVESVDIALKADGSLLKGKKISVVRARINRKKKKVAQ
jgi:RNA recognition motif-containing protein